MVYIQKIFVWYLFSTHLSCRHQVMRSKVENMDTAPAMEVYFMLFAYAALGR